MKMFIGGSCDIGFSYLYMKIKVNESSYDMELKNQDFEPQVERHEGKCKFEQGVDKTSSRNENVHRWLM